MQIVQVKRKVEEAKHATEMTFEERDVLLEAMCRQAGLRRPDTRVPKGSALWEIGNENKRRLAASIDKLPDVGSALTGLRALVHLEAPQDLKDIPVQSLVMDREDGKLMRQGSALGYTESGFSHITQFIRPSTISQGFAENMKALPPDLRAQVFNHWAQNSMRSDKVTLRTILEPRSGYRVVRATTSTKHSLETGDDLAVANAIDEMAARGIFEGAKARITREVDRSEFEIIWPAMGRELRVGDIAKIGVRVKNSETKAGALVVEPYLLQVLCYNFTTAYTEDAQKEENTLSVKHLGDLTSKLPAMFAKAVERIEPFVYRFADAYKQMLPMTRGEALAKLSKQYTRSELPEHTLTLAAQLWDADGDMSPGDTLAGLVNALTRASQELSSEKAGQVEKIAGRLAFRGVQAFAA